VQKKSRPEKSGSKVNREASNKAAEGRFNPDGLDEAQIAAICLSFR
jgi:hypothetical protein